MHRETEKLRSRGLGSQMEESQHLGSSVGFSCIVQQGGGSLHTDRQGVGVITYR